jgi:hypothetical protein
MTLNSAKNHQLFHFCAKKQQKTIGIVLAIQINHATKNKNAVTDPR